MRSAAARKRQTAQNIRGLHILKAAVRAMEGLTDEQRTIAVRPDAVISAGPIEIEVFVDNSRTPGNCRVLCKTGLTGKREEIDWEALYIELRSGHIQTTLLMETDEDDPGVGLAAVELPESNYRVSLGIVNKRRTT